MTKRVMIHLFKGLTLICAAILQTTVCSLLFGRAVAAVVVGVQLLVAAAIICCRIRAPDRD